VADPAELVRALGRGIPHPMGLLPRLLQGAVRAPQRAISTLGEGAPLANVLTRAGAKLISLAPRQALRAVPRHGPLDWLPRAADEGPVVVLGAADADVAWAPHWNLGFTKQRAAKVKTLDTLCAGWPDVAVVVLGDGEEVPQVVQGARTLLLRSQPIVVFDLGGLSARRTLATLDALAKALPDGYQLHDSLLLPAQHSSVQAGESWFAALPQRLQAAPDLLRALGGGPDMAALLQRESRSGGVRSGYTPPRSTRVTFDELLPGTGFYPAERHGEDAWRWIGPVPEATICIPRPFWGAGTLTLSVTGTSTPENISQLRLFVDGEMCPVTAKGAQQAWTLTAPFSSRFGAARSALVVHISIPQTRQMHAEDPRRLGVCLYDLLIERS
jgi:hypothetical protein